MSGPDGEGGTSSLVFPPHMPSVSRGRGGGVSGPDGEGGTSSWVFPPHMPSVSGGRGGEGPSLSWLRGKGLPLLRGPNKGGGSNGLSLLSGPAGGEPL